MNLGEIGLLLIAVAWVIQLVFSWKGAKAIHPVFIIIYMIGVLALVISDYMETNVLSYFELLTFIAAGIVLWRVSIAKAK